MNKKIFKDGIEKAKLSYITFENILLILLLTFGYFGMQSVKIYSMPIISIVYLLFAFSMLLFFLRKNLCTQCYYYGKACHCGWGILASKLFKKESGNQKLGGILAAITWSIIMILPIFVMIVLVILRQVALKNMLFYLIPFIILDLINAILHKVDCEKCKMKYICPGSAAKS